MNRNLESRLANLESSGKHGKPHHHLDSSGNERARNTSRFSHAVDVQPHFNQRRLGVALFSFLPDGGQLSRYPHGRKFQQELCCECPQMAPAAQAPGLFAFMVLPMDRVALQALGYPISGEIGRGKIDMTLPDPRHLLWLEVAYQWQRLRVVYDNGIAVFEMKARGVFERHLF